MSFKFNLALSLGSSCLTLYVFKNCDKTSFVVQTYRSSDLSFQRAVITQTLMLYNYNHHITVWERKNIHPDTMLCIVLINTLPSKYSYSNSPK